MKHLILARGIQLGFRHKWCGLAKWQDFLGKLQSQTEGNFRKPSALKSTKFVNVLFRVLSWNFPKFSFLTLPSKQWRRWMTFKTQLSFEIESSNQPKWAIKISIEKRPLKNYLRLWIEKSPRGDLISEQRFYFWVSSDAQFWAQSSDFWVVKFLPLWRRAGYEIRLPCCVTLRRRRMGFARVKTLKLKQQFWKVFLAKGICSLEALMGALGFKWFL